MPRRPRTIAAPHVAPPLGHMGEIRQPPVSVSAAARLCGPGATATRGMCSPSRSREIVIGLDLNSRRLFRPNSLLEVFVREATGIASGPILVSEIISAVRDHICDHGLVSRENPRLINCDKTLGRVLRIRCERIHKASIRAIIERQLDPKGAPAVSFRTTGLAVRLTCDQEPVTVAVRACVRIFACVLHAYSGYEQKVMLAYVRNQIVDERLLHLLVPRVVKRKRELVVFLYLLRKSRDAHFVNAVCLPG